MATYYVDTAAADDTGDGLTTGTAWKTIAKVNGSSFSAGDSVLFNKGCVWNEKLIPPSSGSAGLPITFGAYGSGVKPIITLRQSIPGWGTGGNWTDIGGNRWTIAFGQNPYRIFLSTTEYYMAQNAAGVNATLRWFWEANVLTVYGTSSPATFYSNVEAAGGEHWDDYSVYINTKAYITLDSLDIQGGWPSVMLYGGDGAKCDHITIQNSSIGKYSWTGIYILATNTPSTNIVIANNVIDSGFNYTGYTWVYPNVNDGISCDTCIGALIYGNTIKDWGHTGVAIYGTATKVGTGNEVYSNTFSGTNSGYMRAFSIIGTTADTARDNKIYRNLATGLTHRNQLGGNNNSVYYNVIYGTTQYAGAGAGSGTAQGIELSNVGEVANVCNNNMVYNNVIYDTQEAGIRIRALAGAETIEHNLIKNNILSSNGTSTLDGYTNIGLVVDSGANIGANTFQYNVIYSASTSTTIGWHGSLLTVAEFDSGGYSGGGIDFSADADLQGWYKMEEADGQTRVDSSDKGNDVADTNTVVRSADKKQGTYSADFELSSATYLSRENANLSAGFPGKVDADLTVVGWVKPESLPNWGIIAAHGDNVWAFKVQAFNSRCNFQVGTDSLPCATNSISTGAWVHLGMTYDGANIRGYVSGAEDAGSPVARVGALPTSTDRFSIGVREAGNTEYFDGLIDDLAVFSRAFSDAEILSIAEHGVDGSGGSVVVTDIYGNNIASNPLFVSSSDFRLRTGSPAINAGVDVGLGFDFAGAAVESPPDIGAFEVKGVGSSFHVRMP